MGQYKNYTKTRVKLGLGRLKKSVLVNFLTELWSEDNGPYISIQVLLDRREK